MQNSSAIAPTNVFLKKDFLTRLTPLLTYYKYVNKETLPAKNSGTMEFARIENIAPLTGATAATVKSMTEGVTPSDTSITLTKIQIATALYANLIRITDQVDILNERAILAEIQKLNAENLAQVQDAVIRDGLLSGTNVQRLTDSIGGVSGAARANVAGVFNPTQLDKALRTMESANCKPFTSAVTASNKYGTSPIDEAYICITHPDASYDLRNMPDFLRVESYPDQSQRLEGEVGAYGRIRFVATTWCRIFQDTGASPSGTKSNGGSANDVYCSLLLSKDAAVAVDLDSVLETVLISSANKDHANPLGLSNAVGYKFRSASGILEDARILRIEHAVSA